MFRSVIRMGGEEEVVFSSVIRVGGEEKEVVFSSVIRVRRRRSSSAVSLGWGGGEGDRVQQCH